MRRELWLPSFFVYLLLVVLLIYMVPQGNFEFIGYAVVVGLLFFVLLRFDDKYTFPLYSVWLFVLWVYMHMLGGIVHIGGVRLYDLVLIPLFNGGGELVLLKYDQFVHAFCYFSITILLFYVLKKYFVKRKRTALLVFAVLSSIGVGLLNEVVEFGMVLFADAAEAVGGYYNTALDLVFNLLGAVFAAFFLRHR